MVRHCLWKMCANIPGACIKPGLVRLSLCHKVNLPSCVARQSLCHKVNLPRCEARRRHLIMTCDIFGTRQMNTYLGARDFSSAVSGFCQVFSRFTNYSPLNSDIDSRFPRKAKLGPYFKVLGILKLENLV